MASWEKRAQFSEELSKDPAVAKKLSKHEIEELFDEDHHRAHVQTIFKRLYGDMDQVRAPHPEPRKVNAAEVVRRGHEKKSPKRKGAKG
jgi:hypothetical protein